MTKIVVYFRAGTSHDLVDINPILKENEIVREIETGRFKIGGSNELRWNDSPYMSTIPEFLYLYYEGEL